MRFSPILQPGIVFRCEAMGLSLPTERGFSAHPAAERFARQLNHGPWDRIVRRRALVRVEADEREWVLSFFDLFLARPGCGRLIGIGNWGSY